MTTDTPVASFHHYLTTLSVGEKFAVIRQGIQLLFIGHLIHVVSAIENVRKDKSLLEPFENSLYAYIGYIQSNGNTSRIMKTFDKLKHYTLLET